MPPKKQQKTKTEKQSEKDKNLLSMKEKVLKIKRDVLQTVESMLGDNVSKNWFLENCSKLCKQDYADVVQERSIEHICGYPLCDNPIVTIKKQYHISTISNKVYDITERKCFCCNACFKASNYIKAQLADLPLYMRKTEKEAKKFELLCDSDNKGSVGDEVVFRRSLSKDEVEEHPIPPEVLDNDRLSNILREEVKGCEQHLTDLKITEKVYEKPFVFGSMKQEKSSKDENDLFSESSDGEVDEESEEDDKHILFPDYDNLSVLSNKHMPIRDKTKKTVAISPIKFVKTAESPSVTLSIKFVNDVFQDWFTEDTMKYILGEKKVYSIKADKLFQTMISSDDSPSSDKLSSIKKEYIELCLKINNLKDDEDISNSDEEGILDLYSTKSKESNPEVLCINRIPEPKSVPKPRSKRNSKGKKTVSFKEQSEKEGKKLPKVYKDMIKESEKLMNSSNCNSSSESSNAGINSLPEPAFPLIDSISQNALRKQVLASKLKAVYFDILPDIGLHYRDIRDGFMRITETFSLTPTNVSYKPKEWKCIALVLFRILTKTTLQDLEQEEGFDFPKLCESITKQINISISEIENLVSNLISPEQVERLQGSYKVK